jgi:hypothetical protein
VRTRLAALAVVYLAAHILCLPPSLEDLDSINFALGVRDFDVARHQPHPPGYPVFIALAKVSTAGLRAIGAAAADARGLAIWSAVSGASAILLLFAFYRALDGSASRAAWAAVIAACAPLFWFTALRPLSDMTGLAFIVAAQALIASVLFISAGPERSGLRTDRDMRRPGLLGPASGLSGLAGPERSGLRTDRDMRRPGLLGPAFGLLGPAFGLLGPANALIAGAFVAGLAIGVRAQSFVLTLPLLALALAMPAHPIPWRPRALAVAAFGAGVLAWGLPLIVASGGPGEYLAALGAQGGEDLSGVPILWTMRTKAVLKQSLLNTYIWPWHSAVLAGIVLAMAAAGFVRIAWQAPRVAIVLAAAFAPYAIFHPLFHDAANSRNALPLLVPVAYLFVAGADLISRYVLPFASAAVAGASLVLAIPPSVSYAREGSPAFHALRDVNANAADGRVLGMHGTFKRAIEAAPPLPADRILTSRHGFEWMRLVEHWRARPDVPAWFLADPKRSDLALVDPMSRRLARRYRWPFFEPPYVGGARPGNVDLLQLSPPGWILDRGWGLTAEIAGVTMRDRLGPHNAPAIAWIRGRDEAATMILGGQHVGGPQAPSARISVSAGGTPLDTFEVPFGLFHRRIEIPAGTFAGGASYRPLDVRSQRADGPGEMPVVLQQFDLQSPGVPMLLFEDGWQEPEYELLSGRAWRWMSEQARLWVRPVGRDVTLRLSGESPLRYYGAPPVIRVMAGEAELARFSPSADFSEEIVVRSGALVATGGQLVVTSDKFFVPAERGGPPDRRHLAIRMYTVEVR